MADRITRPTVKLAGTLPPGNLSNLEEQGAALLGKRPPDLYALSLLTRAKVTRNDDQDGEEQATVRTRAVEVLPDGVFPFAIPAGTPVAEVIEQLRSDRTGAAMLPIATTAEQTERDDALAELREWADANLDTGVDGLAAEWGDYFADRSPAGVVTTWRDAPAQMMREFLAYRREQAADAEPEHVDPESGTVLEPGDEQHDEFPPAEDQPPHDEQTPTVPAATFTDAEPPAARRRTRANPLLAAAR